jgi:hypothetical protein
VGGQGPPDPTGPGEGKGGAIFIYAFDSTHTITPADYLGLLQAQTFSGNSAANLPGPGKDRTYDNDDFYIAKGIFTATPGAKARLP